MKQIKNITGINFLALLLALFSVKLLANPGSIYVYLIPVLVLTLINMGMAVFCFSTSKKILAKSFVLSGLIVLVVGTSSCVTIVPRKKKSKPDKPVKAIPEAVEAN